MRHTHTHTQSSEDERETEKVAMRKEGRKLPDLELLLIAWASSRIMYCHLTRWKYLMS